MPPPKRPAPRPLPLAPAARSAPREIDVIALLVVVLTSLLAWSARYTINPDGVSYLNLAQALRDGRWSDFVQGYWSPLYPALVALASLIVGGSNTALLLVAHALNAIAVAVSVAVLWHWTRRWSSPWMGRAMMAALLVSGARPPRVEAVTPDLLLLALALWLGYELIEYRGTRWLRTGLAMGLMFLAKTSAWPWLLLTTLLWWWVVGRAERRRYLLAILVCWSTVALWAVPLSIDTGHPTLGASARLNYCWYLQSCDSQSPDGHAGQHRNYQAVRLNDGREIAVASFDATLPWTYQPWGDPVAWDQGVISATRTAPSIGALARYWGDLTLNVLGFWMSQLVLVVLLPMYFLARRPGLWRELVARRQCGMVILLGAAGIAQFVVVHAEPRLIAPYVLLMGVGVLAWLQGERETASGGQAVRNVTMWQVCSGVGLLVGLGMTLLRVQEGLVANQRIADGIRMMQQAGESVLGGETAGRRVVVVGNAMPIVANAYLLDWQIVAQVRPASVPAINSLPPEQMVNTLNTLFGGSADVAWITLPDGQFQFAKIGGR